MEKTAKELGVSIEQAPDAAHKFVKEWKDLRSKVSSLEKELASFKSSKVEFEKLGNINFYMDNLGEADMGEVQKLVRKITSTDGNLAAIGFSKGAKGSIILASSNSLGIDCGSVLKEALHSAGGSGGGKASYAQGACSSEKISSVLSYIKDLIA